METKDQRKAFEKARDELEKIGAKLCFGLPLSSSMMLEFFDKYGETTSKALLVAADAEKAKELYD